MDPINSNDFNLRLERAGRTTKILSKFSNYLMYDFLGGPKIFTAQSVIKWFYPTVFVVGLSIKLLVGNSSIYSWVSSSLYFSYVLFWVLRSFTIPDASWSHKQTLASNLVLVFFNFMTKSVGLYFVLDYRPNQYPTSEGPWIGLSVLVYLIGFTFFIFSDVQKYYTLQQKKGLIVSGIFRYIRHPNYLGEILIYTSFTMLAFDWIPFIWSSTFLLGTFLINISVKEASMSRYPEWKIYTKKAGLFWPKFW